MMSEEYGNDILPEKNKNVDIGLEDKPGKRHIGLEDKPGKHQIGLEDKLGLQQMGLEDELGQQRITCFGTLLRKGVFVDSYMTTFNAPKTELYDNFQDLLTFGKKLERTIARTDVFKFIKLWKESEVGSRICPAEDDDELNNNTLTFPQFECTKRIGPLTASGALAIFAAVDVLEGYRALQSVLLSVIVKKAMKDETVRQAAAAFLLETMQLVFQKLKQGLAGLGLQSLYDQSMKDLQNLKHEYRTGLTGTFNTTDVAKITGASGEEVEDQIDQPDFTFKDRKKDDETDPFKYNLLSALSENRNIAGYEHFAGKWDDLKQRKYSVSDNLVFSPSDYYRDDDHPDSLHTIDPKTIQPNCPVKELSDVIGYKSGEEDFQESRKISGGIHSDSAGSIEQNFCWKNSDENPPARKLYQRKTKDQLGKVPDLLLEIGKNGNIDPEPKNGLGKKSVGPRRSQGIHEFRNLISVKPDNSFQRPKLYAALLRHHGSDLHGLSRDSADSDFVGFEQEWSTEAESVDGEGADTYSTDDTDSTEDRDGIRAAREQPMCGRQGSNISEILLREDDTGRAVLSRAIGEASQSEEEDVTGGRLSHEHSCDDTDIEADGPNENCSQVLSLDGDMLHSQASFLSQPVAVATSDTSGHPPRYQEWIPVQSESPNHSIIQESNSSTALQHLHAAGGVPVNSPTGSSYSFGHDILAHPQDDDSGPSVHEELYSSTPDLVGATGYTAGVSSSVHQNFLGATPVQTAGPDVSQPRAETSPVGSAPLQLPPITVHAAGSLPPCATEVARIDLSQAANREFAPLRERRATYDDDWPSDDSGIDPANMALAGFYHIGPDRRVRCFYCGLELEHFAPGDNVWDEHVRHRPTCPYLLAIMGEDMVLTTQINLSKKH